MGDYSDFLFARPSFIEGVARILDFGNTLNQYNTSADADTIALTMDMYAVGDDLREAIVSIASEGGVILGESTETEADETTT